EGQGVYPTPVVGMLGLIEDARHTTTQWFKEAGDVILLLGATRGDLGASELLSVLAGEASGAVPRLDLDFEKSVQKACLDAIQAGLVRSARLQRRGIGGGAGRELFLELPPRRCRRANRSDRTRGVERC